MSMYSFIWTFPYFCKISLSLVALSSLFFFLPGWFSTLSPMAAECSLDLARLSSFLNAANTAQMDGFIWRLSLLAELSGWHVVSRWQVVSRWHIVLVAGCLGAHCLRWHIVRVAFCLGAYCLQWGGEILQINKRHHLLYNAITEQPHILNI